MKNLVKKISFIIIIILLLESSIVTANIGFNRKVSLLDAESQDNLFELTGFDLKMRLIMKLGQYPSLSTCIIRNESVIWEKFYGWSNIYRLKRPTRDTVYLLGSVTKTVLSTAMMKLYENNLYDLDEDVNNYLNFSLRNPNYPDVNITFRMLLNHTASIYDFNIFKIRGLPYLFKVPGPEALGPYFKKLLVPGEEWYNEEFWTDDRPGSKARYSNNGFLLVGHLFTLIANQSLEEYCQENIFQPLGMNNTSFSLDYFDKNQLARPYIHKLGIYFPLPFYDVGGLAVMGGLRTTINDFSRYLMMHINGGEWNGIRILNESTVEMMHNISSLIDEADPRLKENERAFGLGWWRCYKDDRYIEGHAGMCPGAVCYMFMNRTTGTGVILLSNHLDLFGFWEPKFIIKRKTMFLMGSLLFDKAEEL